VIALLLAMAWGQDCPDVSPTLRRAQESLLLMEDRDAAEAIAEIEASFGCGFISDDNLARYWLLVATQRFLAGEEGYAERFRAAAAAEPDTWIVDLGDAVRAAYDEAVAEMPDDGRIDVTGVPTGWVVRVDGRARELPAELPAGTHLVQVGPDLDTVEVHRLAVLVAGQGTVIDADIEGYEPPPPPSTSGSMPVRAHAAAGVQLTQGEELTRQVQGDAVTEPATKLAVPLELGLALAPGPWWARLQLGVAPQASGGLLYLGSGEVRSASTAVEIAAAGGVTVASVDLGVLAGVSVPSRTVVRAVAALPIVGPLAGELRVGANVHPARGVEPGGSLHVVFRPTLTGG